MNVETVDKGLNLNVFTHVTKKVCICSFVSMVLIMLFIVSPLSYLVKTSAIAKIITIFILCYTVYLNILQTKSLKGANIKDKNQEVVSQYNMNILCSNIFTFFLILLTIFVIKSFF